MRARWVFAVIAGLLLLCAAFLVGGGIYRTVNAGDGHVYIVNRFTGSTRAVRWGEEHEVAPQLKPKPPLKGADLAIALAKNRHYDVGGYGRNFDFLKMRLADPEANDEVEMLGWKAVRPFPQSYWHRNTYLVSFTYRVAERREETHARELLELLSEDLMRSTWDVEGFALTGDIEKDLAALRKGPPIAELRNAVKTGRLAPDYADEAAWWALARSGEELGWFWLVDPVKREVDLVRLPPAKAEEYWKQWGAETAQQIARNGPTLKPVLAQLNASCPDLLDGEKCERAELALEWIGAR